MAGFIFYMFHDIVVGADALIGPKAPSTKRGLAEQSEVWGSLKNLLPPDRRWRSSPLYEEGGFPLRRGGAEQSPAPTSPPEDSWKIHGIATPACALARNDTSIIVAGR